MHHPLAPVRAQKELTRIRWPACAQQITAVGDAWVAVAASDFHINDFNLVRQQFPGRHVTLDGDVITIWPRPAHAR